MNPLFFLGGLVASAFFAGYEFRVLVEDYREARKARELAQLLHRLDKH